MDVSLAHKTYITSLSTPVIPTASSLCIIHTAKIGYPGGITITLRLRIGKDKLISDSLEKKKRAKHLCA